MENQNKRFYKNPNATYLVFHTPVPANKIELFGTLYYA